MRHRTISCIHLGKLNILKSILNSWINNNILLADAWQGKDVPWTYNERALLSVFSGGIWKNGGVALEEYSFTKTLKRKAGERREPYQGRQDIYFKIGKHEFMGEVKADWTSLPPEGKHPKKSINSAMKSAIKDLKDCPPHSKRRLAMVFVRTYIKRRHSKLIENSITNWARKVKDGVDYTCCAWVFPGNSRNFHSKRYIYPGVGVFIKEIRGKKGGVDDYNFHKKQKR